LDSAGRQRVPEDRVVHGQVHLVAAHCNAVSASLRSEPRSDISLAVTRRVAQDCNAATCPQVGMLLNGHEHISVGLHRNVARPAGQICDDDSGKAFRQRNPSTVRRTRRRTGGRR
jgi:hypothetical protein